MEIGKQNGGSCEDGEGGCVEDMMLEEWALGVQGEVRSVVKLLYVQSPDFLRCMQVTSAPTWEDQTAEGAWGSPVEERPASSGPNMWMISFNPHSTPARFLFVLFSCQAMSDSSPPHGLQHASLPCPLPFPRVCPKFMSVESVMPSNHLILCTLFFYLQSFPASGSFPVSQLFTSGVQSIGA